MSINDAIKKTVREGAEYLCEYCHSPERLSANRFTIDHVIPRSLEGSDEIGNNAIGASLLVYLGLSNSFLRNHPIENCQKLIDRRQRILIGI
jgi:HNH endonuclease